MRVLSASEIADGLVDHLAILAGAPRHTSARHRSMRASAWVIVPLVEQRPWAAVNEALQGTGEVNGYGARQVIDWLFSGQLLDSGRLPVITACAALGLALAWLAWSADADTRALLAALAVCLLFAFGRTTSGRSST
jgi:hypothetical protein